MDIVLNTYFNNPKLPVVQLPGFVDSFNRADGPFESTTDGKPWESITSSSLVWGVTDNRGGLIEGSGNNYGLAVVDALATDGTLTAVLDSVDPSDLRTGLAVHVQDDSNYTSILLGVGTTSPGIRIQSRINGSATTNDSDSNPIEHGDTITVITSGPSVVVEVNGTQRLAADVPELAGNTRHGFYSYGSARAYWDSISFTPA